MRHCENCGSRVYDGACVNCDEAIYIVDQYHELDMSLPDSSSELMQDYNRAKIDQSKRMKGQAV